MGNAYPGPQGRQRAIDLKAADARLVLVSTLPYVLAIVTADELGQVQKVLDAAVVNPVVQKEYDDLMRKSVIAQSGGLANRDPDMVKRAKKVLDGLIQVSEQDKHLRLDYAKLLMPGALQTTTDNPDEARYLDSIRHTLTVDGAWLRFDYKMVRDPDDRSRWVMNQRTFEAWLSVGYDGDTIATPDGRLTRDALLDTRIFGAGYYRKVIRGNVQTALDKAVRYVRNKISDGETLHDMEDNARHQAVPGVAGVSDTLGGADFPSKSIWKPPNELVVRALSQNSNGNVKDASKTIFFAAEQTKAAARILDQYIEDTTKGAQRAVTILTVVKTAGRIAEIVLVIEAVIGSIIRFAASEGIETSTDILVNRPLKNRSPGAYYPTNYNGRAALEKTLNQASMTLDTDAGVGTALDRYDLEFQQRVNGWYNDFQAAQEAAYAAKGTRFLTVDELEQLTKPIDAKWGNPMEFLP